MMEWFEKKKRKTRKRKKNRHDYTVLDCFLDVLLWIPELLLLPFRLIFWLFRGIGKLMDIV
ncbi:hypothetical protein Q5760_12080 [Niallia sp. Krafla_26]